MNASSSSSTTFSPNMHLDLEGITVTVPTKTYDGDSSPLKKRKVCHDKSSSSSYRLIELEDTMEHLTALVLGHEEKTSDISTSARVDKNGDWEDLVMGGKKDSYMLIARRLGKLPIQGQDKLLQNEEWGDASSFGTSSTPALLARSRKNSFAARSA